MIEPTFEGWVRAGEHLDFRGHRVFVRTEGPDDGPPVTLVHGYPTSSHDWALVVPALVEAGCRVVTMDLLGFGASDKPARHDYRLVEQADLVEAVWAHVGVTSTALVAHDYGVSVAQELLARDPARFPRTAWLNGGLYPDLHRPIAVQRLLHGPLGPLLGRLTSERTFRASLGRVLGRPVDDGLVHEMWLATSRGGGTRVQHRLLRYIDDRAEHAARWTGALEAYPGPMLFVWGPADPVSGAHVVPRLGQRLPQAEVVVLDEEPATGHYPQVENPAAVIDSLVPFLTGSSGD